LRHAVAPAVSGGAPGPRCRISWHRKRLRHPAWSRVTGNACAMPWHPQLAEGRQAPGVESAGTGNARAIPLGRIGLMNYRMACAMPLRPALPETLAPFRLVPRHRKRLRQPWHPAPES
jgi:hypothetical protein